METLRRGFLYNIVIEEDGVVVCQSPKLFFSISPLTHISRAKYYVDMTKTKRTNKQENLNNRAQYSAGKKPERVEPNLIPIKQYAVFKGSAYSVPIFIISIVSLAVYANTLRNGFVYDDAFTIVGNSFIRNLDNLPKLIEKEYFGLSGEMTYRPIVTFSYFLDYALYGLAPWGFHLTNILLHATNGLLFYVFLLLVYGQIQIEVKSQQSVLISLLANKPLLLTLLFVTHPVLTEPVNAISYREDLLVFLFYITTLNLYLISRATPAETRRPFTANIVYSLSCITYSLALLSKEMAVTIPLIICCYEWLCGDKKKGIFSKAFNPYNIGYIIVTLSYCYLYFYYFYNPVERITPDWALNERLLTIPWTISNYLKLIFLPISLSADYEILSVKSLFSLLFVMPAVALFLILSAAYIVKRKNPDIAFGTLFFVLTLLPVYNIISIGNPFAERYLYLPTAGFMLAAGFVMFKTSSSHEKHPKYWQQGVVVVLVSVFFLLTVQRNHVWHDEYSLWSDALKKQPDSARAHLGMGTAYATKGLLDEAIREYKESVRLAPYYPDSFYGLGLAYYKKGVGMADKTLSVKKELIAEAIRQYRKALEIVPIRMDIRNSLAILYEEQGMLEEAIKENSEILRYRPADFDALIQLGLIYFQKGLYEDALLQYKRALSIAPESAASYNNIGMVYAVTGQTGEAESWFKKGLVREPESAETYYNLGFLYQNVSRLDEAGKAYKRALEINPDYEEARIRLGEVDMGSK